MTTSPFPRELRERLMEDHRECCDYHGPDERCGAVTENKKHVCTRAPNHDRRHYDAVDCVQWEVTR
jgi:hypothetical protein